VPDGVLDEIVQPVDGGVVVVGEAFAERGGVHEGALVLGDGGGEEGFDVAVVGGCGGFLAILGGGEALCAEG